MKVVIVEDERLTAMFLEETLEKLGCLVVGLFDEAATVLEFVEHNAVDFIIMDVEIQGDLNGVQAAIELRKKFNIPSVFITAHNDSTTISNAMQAEPLGYVIKPISVSHVESVVGVVKGLLGVKSKTNSASIPGQTLLGLGYSYHYETKNLFRDDAPVELTSSELKLFDLCLRRQGSIVPYDVIDEHVWDTKVVSDSTRRGLYHRLRHKLNNQLFETVTGIGCRIQLPGR
ncbi:MAG: response regulator [Halopseudomonas sp.]